MMKRQLNNSQNLISLSKAKGVAKRFWWLLCIGIMVAVLFVLYECKISSHSNIDAVKTNLTIYLDSSGANASIKNDHVQEAGIMADSLSNIKSDEVVAMVNSRLKEQGLEPVTSGADNPVIFYDYATSKTATIQISGLDPNRSKEILYAYVYSLNHQPQEILKGTTIKVLRNSDSKIERSSVTTGVSVMRVALIFAMSIVVVGLLFVILVLFDKRIWSVKDVLRIYSGITFGDSLKSVDNVNYKLIEKVTKERDLKGAVAVLSGNNFAEGININSERLRIVDSSEYGSIKRSEGVILLIELGKTKEAEIDIAISQIAEIGGELLGHIVYKK